MNERNVQLKTRLSQEKILLVPGAYDGLSAKLVEQSGAEAVYLSGSGVAASHGLPDIGLITFRDMVERARQIATVVKIPIIADADTGYGNVTNVVYAVQGFEQAGVSAIQIEDQTFPKRCGHFEGKQVVPLEEMLTKIYAVLDTRRNDNFLIIARTDTRATHGLAEAIRRGQAFAKAGADVVFIEAPQTREELQQISNEIDAPLLVNLPEGGKTPLLAAQELEALGYDIVIHANMALRVAVKQMLHALKILMETGTSEAILDQLISFEERDQITERNRFHTQEQLYLQKTLAQLSQDLQHGNSS